MHAWGRRKGREDGGGPCGRKNLDGAAGKVLKGGMRLPKPAYKVELGGWTSQYC